MRRRLLHRRQMSADGSPRSLPRRLNNFEARNSGGFSGSLCNSPSLKTYRFLAEAFADTGSSPTSRHSSSVRGTLSRKALTPHSHM